MEADTRPAFLRKAQTDQGLRQENKLARVILSEVDA
jgi:hypothetical protein